MGKKFKLGRKFKTFLSVALLVALSITCFPVKTAAAANMPADVSTGYLQLANNQIMPRSTTYFFPDQEFSFRGSYTTPLFYVPSACQARLVIAAIGSEPLYIDVLNARGAIERTITVMPNESQVKVFNITSGNHSLRFDSVNSSQFTIRFQMYTWDY